MTSLAEQIQHLQKHPELIDPVLYPGKQLADFNPDDLTIQILPSGFRSFDENKVLKYGRGELVLIGARPSVGKSALLFQLATSIAAHSKVHVFSLEMDHASVVTRQISALINRPVTAIQRGLNPREVEVAQAQLRKLNFHIDDRSGLSIQEICYAARQENARSKTSAVFIDYIQLIRTEKGHSRANEVALVSGELKALAKDIGVPVVAASQLNRNGDYRENKLPQLSDLKESGSLEQDADVVVLLSRDPQFPKETTFDIAKNRNGPTRQLRFEFAPAQAMFIEMPETRSDI